MSLEVNPMPNTPSIFRRQIALPQDHGSWVFILGPLITGLFAGGQFSAASLALVLAAMAAFLIRQPVTAAIKAYSGRRPRSDLPAARFWMGVYGTLVVLCITELAVLGDTYVIYLGIPVIPVFAWHLWLVSRRDERRQSGIEILATGVLALAAPAAYWIGKGAYQPVGWLLWILVWSQSAASIVYAYLRLEQRGWKPNPALKIRFKAGARAISYAIFNLFLALALGFFQIIPMFVFSAFLVQALETVYGTVYPAIGAKPVSIGTRQLIVSIIFTVLFITNWR
jgi:O-antigen/teichoic acid export membrane protein